VTDANNGARNETLATLNTLADLVAVCGSDPSAAARGQVLRATTPAGRPAPPDAWILALLYTDDGLYASGRIAVDGRGNVWSSDNWQPGTKDPSTGFTNGGLNHPQGIARRPEGQRLDRQQLRPRERPRSGQRLGEQRGPRWSETGRDAGGDPRREVRGQRHRHRP
jgi:hypothetical protein